MRLEVVQRDDCPSPAGGGREGAQRGRGRVVGPIRGRTRKRDVFNRLRVAVDTLARRNSRRYPSRRAAVRRYELHLDIKRVIRLGWWRPDEYECLHNISAANPNQQLIHTSFAFFSFSSPLSSSWSFVSVSSSSASIWIGAGCGVGDLWVLRTLGRNVLKEENMAKVAYPTRIQARKGMLCINGVCTRGKAGRPKLNDDGGYDGYGGRTTYFPTSHATPQAQNLSCLFEAPCRLCLPEQASNYPLFPSPRCYIFRHSAL